MNSGLLEVSNPQTKQEENNPSQTFIDIYTLKKASVIVMLLKILYWALVIVLFGIGIYYIHKSHNEEYHKEELEFLKVSNEWNTSKYSDLQEWKVYLKNENNDSILLDKSYNKYNTFVGSNNLYYQPFEFIKNNTVSLLQRIPLEKSVYESSYGGYNLTTSLYLITDNTFSLKTIKLDHIDFFIKKISPGTTQSQCAKEKASWNYESEACYKYYMLRTLCIIIDQNSRELYYDYKNFKCNGFDNWFQSYTFFPWNIPNFDPSFDDIEASGKKISLYVSTNYDPFVFSSYNDSYKLNKIYKFYNRCGVWCLGISIFLLIIPLLLIARDYYESKKPLTPESLSIYNTSFKTNPMRI